MGAGTITTIVALVLVMVLLVVVLAVVLRQRRSTGDTQSATLIQDQITALRQETTKALNASTEASDKRIADLTGQLNQRLSDLNRQMQDTTGQIGKRLDTAGRTVERVSTSLGELSKATEQVIEVGRDISSLQDILRTPKLRGIVGEYFLGDLLKQVVPSNYELQYRFQSGEAVDAVVKLSHRLVPIDAKFPLEDFQRLSAESGEDARKALRRKFLAVVKKHVDAVAKKYIIPDEGTFDFALMYIPAENVYYETIIKDSPDETSISDYALERRVIPVSPNSLYAYLQAIVLGLRGFEIEKRAEEILKHLGRLQQEYRKFNDEFDVLGTHLKNARNKYDDAVRRLDVFEQKLALGSEIGQPGSETGELPGRKE
jgi:DNA recombination protein RmuC